MAKVIVSDVVLGEIEDNLADQICLKYNGRDISEIAIDFMRKLIDKSDDMNLGELIKYAQFRKNCFGYETIADMISDHMKSDLRPSNEICKNCDSYYDHLCLDILMEVNPFTKGNSCWKERKENNNITSIDLGYALHGEVDDNTGSVLGKLRSDEFPKDKVVTFRRPRWIIKEESKEMMSIDELNSYMEDIISSNPDVGKAECDKRAEEEEINIPVTKEELDIIIGNIDCFIEISGYLYSIWLTAREHGLSSIRNVVEEPGAPEGELTLYINERVKEAIDAKLIEKIPPDPLDNTLESILTSYSNLVLMSLVTGNNPNMMKAIVRCFVDKSIYTDVMKQITDYTSRYFWLREKN